MSTEVRDDMCCETCGRLFSFKRAFKDVSECAVCVCSHDTTHIEEDIRTIAGTDYTLEITWCQECGGFVEAGDPDNTPDDAPDEDNPPDSDDMSDPPSKLGEF